MKKILAFTLVLFSIQALAEEENPSRVEKDAIAAARAAYKASGGKIDKDERKVLSDMRKEANDNIKKEKQEAAKAIAAERLAKQDEAKAVNQAARIEHGVATGSLNAGEAAKLKAEQDAIAKAKEAYKASDGIISRSENQILQGMRKEASENIYKEKHDDQADRAQKQNIRIENGIKTGELTPEEAEVLKAEQQALNQRVQDALAGTGRLTDADRALIKKARDEASKNIFSEKHDKEFVADTIAEKKRAIQDRIANGVQKGSLTQEEMDKIKAIREQLSITRRGLASDGLTDEETAILREAQQKIAETVKKLKKNKDVAQ